MKIVLQKGKRHSLYSFSPPKPHSVKIKCTVSGVLEKEFEWIRKDLTKYDEKSVILEGTFFQGKNNINLDFEFTTNPVDKNSKGSWQFQYDDGKENNFRMLIFVDGELAKILTRKDNQ